MEEERSELEQQLDQGATEQQEDVALPEVDTTQPAEASEEKALNIRELRLAKERAEKERAALERQLKEYQKERERAQQPQQQEDQLEFGDDDLIEGRHLRAMQKQLKAFQQQQVDNSDETRLKTRYNDFDKVVNQDNLERLQHEDPEFAETIALSRSSLYARGSSTYKRIKELGIFVEDTHKKERQRVEQNAAKPRAMNSIAPQEGQRPLEVANAFADGLTPELKRQLLREMEEAAKRA